MWHDIERLKMKIRAFTLAETLVVIGIIGVVASLTLPNLNQSTGNKEKVVKVKKIYQNLVNALGRAEVKYGPMRTWPGIVNGEGLSAVTVGSRITDFLKVSKVCGATYQGCFIQPGTWKRLAINLQDGCAYFITIYSFVLADGTAILVRQHPGPGIDFWVDIDGADKGQSKLGVDIFVFSIFYNENQNRHTNLNELEPNCNYGWTDAQIISNLKNTATSGGVCAAKWVIDYDNMDYLKCLNSLSATVTTCK